MVRLMPKILVVDDEEDILELAEELFEMANFTVESKSSALEAMQYLESGEQVDAIVSDVVMPDMNGIEFFKALKEKNLLVKPFVFVIINQHSDVGDGIIIQPPVFFEFQMVLKSNQRQRVKMMNGLQGSFMRIRLAVT